MLSTADKLKTEAVHMPEFSVSGWDDSSKTAQCQSLKTTVNLAGMPPAEVAAAGTLAAAAVVMVLVLVCGVP